jgi:putative NADH-flavin reductase
MKVAVIGATGRAGSCIVEELLRRGHQVTAIARHADKLPARAGLTVRPANADHRQALAALLEGHDAVVSALRFVDSDARKLIEAVRASGVKRYLVVGGAGSLEVGPGKRLIDTPEFPAAYKAEAAAGGVFLDLLRQETELEWTFLSPSALFFEGARTGNFRLGTDQLLTNDKGSSISFADFAIALVDEIETPRHVRRRFTVGY